MHYPIYLENIIVFFFFLLINSNNNHGYDKSFYIKLYMYITIISGLFVAATTVTLTNGSIPSNSLNSCDRTLSATDVSSPPLLTAKESISSYMFYS